MSALVVLGYDLASGPSTACGIVMAAVYAACGHERRWMLSEQALYAAVDREAYIQSVIERPCYCMQRGDQ